MRRVFILCLSFACGGTKPAAPDAGPQEPIVPIEAHLTLDHTPVVLPGERITADASATLGTGPIHYYFDWGDLSAEQAQTTPTATHAYRDPHGYTVRMTAVNGVSPAQTVTAQIFVSTPAPPVAALVLPAGAMPGGTVTADASSSTAPDGQIVSYRFVTNTGIDTTQASPRLDFAAASVVGNWVTIDLTVTDDHRQSSKTSAAVQVGLAMTDKLVASEAADFWRSAPFLTRDDAGNLAAIWYDNGGLAFSRSTDGGATWAAQTVITPDDPVWVASIIPDATVAIAGDGSIHVGWTWTNQVTLEVEFAYARSYDGGRAFTPVEFFDPVDGFSTASPRIVRTGDSRLTAIWAQVGDAAVENVAISDDDGAHWQLAGQLPFGDCAPSLAYAGGVLYAAWEEEQIGGPNPFWHEQFASSTDGGRTFSTPITIDTSDNSWCPALAARGGRVAMAWSVGNIAENQIVYLSVSDDGGATWPAPAAVTPGAENSVCPDVELDDGGNLYLAWSANQISDPDILHYGHSLAISSDGGRTFGPIFDWPRVDDYSACVSIEAVSPGQLDLIWSAWTRRPVMTYDVHFGTAEVSLP
jgi:PKD domain